MKKVGSKTEIDREVMRSNVLLHIHRIKYSYIQQQARRQGEISSSRDNPRISKQ